MGKRGPKKGNPYSGHGDLNKVKIALYRHRNPAANWTEIVHFIDPDSKGLSYQELKNNRGKPAKRRLSEFENVFNEGGIAKAKELERLANGRPASKALWSITRADDGQFCVICEGTDTKNHYPLAELEHKRADIVSYLNGEGIADWMLDFGLTSEKLARARDRKAREAETVQDLLNLRGDEHLHVVSILEKGKEPDTLKECAELATKEQVFKQLEIVEQTAVAAMMAAIEKDNTKT